MNKNTNNSSIKRRLIALLTIAVFVFVMGFYPVNVVSAADPDGPVFFDLTEADQDMEVGEEDTDVEALNDAEGVQEEQAEEEEDADIPSERSMGHIDLPSVKERLSVKKSEEPAYLKKKESKLEKDLDSVYDPRNSAFYKNRVKMLNQEDTGTCWAHSIATTAQVSYLKELSSQSALGSYNYELAPLDFAYNFYHRVPYKKYGYTYYDKNKPIGYNWKDIGGNNWMSTLALSGWMGMHALENSSYKDSNAYNNSLVVENAKWINDVYKKALVGSKKYDCYVLDQPLVKQAIKDYGAVSVALNWEDEYWKSGGTATWRGSTFDSFNCDYTYEYYNGWRDYIGTQNHEVVLIGWDNDFPKENFEYQPQNDGAWIMQNSWGTKDIDGSTFRGKGYWYVSYEDLSLCSAVALDMQPADTYDANYQYDGNAWCDGGIGTDKGDLVANIFTVPDDGKRHTVEAVGFNAWDNYLTKYKVYVYKDVTGKPTTGTLAATINVQTETPGFYTFKLSKYGAAPVNLNTGEKYSVVIEPTYITNQDEYMWLGAEMSDNWGWVKFTSTGKKKTSYYKDSATGKWYDIYNDNKSASLRIKGFTTTVNRISISGATVTFPQNNYDCTGKQIKPEPIVKYNGTTLVKGEDYTLSYGKNKYPGKGTVKVVGKGLYKSSTTKKFNIAGVNNFQQASATTNSVTLTWDQSPNVKGYKIYKKKGSKFKLVKTIKKNSTVSYTVKKLKADTEYQFKIKTYKKVGKKTYNGPLSNAIVVRTEPIL